jgi:hypothetical protein
MKLIASAVLIAALAVLSGCNRGIAGGPGVVGKTTTKLAFTESTDTFNLSVPILPTTIKQGERIATEISIKRGKNFDEDVALKFSNLPKGVRLEPSPALIKHGDAEAKLTLRASSDAALGDFTISVTGHPTKGADALIGYKIAVDKQ